MTAPTVTRLRLEPGQSAFFHAQSKYVAAVTGVGTMPLSCGQKEWYNKSKAPAMSLPSGSMDKPMLEVHRV